ncbi:alpha/beta hydrolase family protein [Gordonia sp. NPDC003424]
MFEYFQGNKYVWNFAIAGALNSGGRIDEIDRACRPLRDVASTNEDVGTEDFLRTWTALVDQLEEQAEENVTKGHLRTAGQTYARAANYLITAERMQKAGTPERDATYDRCLKLMERSFELADPLTRRVEVPFRDTTLPAYFTKPITTDGAPVPAMIQWNGLDSTKEHMYVSEHSRELAARGIATLMVDTPGSGEALRKQGLTAQINTEEWAAACVDFLENDPAIDSSRVGIVGWSLGGYYAPRAAAFEKRLALCVAWGANHDWGKVQRRRVEREGERPVPHYWEHVLWVWGETDLDTFLDMADNVNLDGVVEQITVPFLVAHGAGDRQIPVELAQRSYDQAVNSPKRELRVFTADEGATEHIGLDNFGYVSSFVADWVADTFAELAAAPEPTPEAVAAR